MDDEFRTAVTALLPRLRRFAMALAGTTAAGDQLVQAACARVLGSDDDRPPGVRLDAWLYQIMWAHWTAEAAAPSTVTPAARVSPDGGAAPPAPSGAPPTLDVVRREIAAMPADDRALLVLVCADGFTYQEAAAALGMPIATVTRRLARTRLALLDGAGAPSKTREQ